MFTQAQVFRHGIRWPVLLKISKASILVDLQCLEYLFHCKKCIVTVAAAAMAAVAVAFGNSCGHGHGRDCSGSLSEIETSKRLFATL